jgi:hypothetical protein
MKKIIYSLVIMIAAGSLFTSCIEQLEPVGLQDLRFAKAEYIRALKELRSADAALQLAKAAVEQANARYRDAETKWMEQVAANQALLNEYQDLMNQAREDSNAYLAAEFAAKIAALEMEMEELGAKHAINMKSLERQYELSKDSLRVTLRNIALYSQALTKQEAEAVVDATKAYEKAFLKVDSLKIVVMKDEWRVDSLKMEKERFTDTVWNNITHELQNTVEYYEQQIKIAEVEQAVAAALLLVVPEEDAQMKEWAELLDQFDQDSTELAYEKAQIEQEWADYFVTYVHDGAQIFNDSLKVWQDELGDNPVPAWFGEDQLDTLANPLTQDDFVMGYADTIAMLPLEWKANPTYNKFFTMLSRLWNKNWNEAAGDWWQTEDGTDIIPLEQIVVGGKTYMTPQVNHSMQEYVLGTDKGTVDSQVYTEEDEDGNLTVAVTADYGLVGALSVLKRKDVTPEEDLLAYADSAKKYSKRWKNHREILAAVNAYYPEWKELAAGAKVLVVKNVAEFAGQGYLMKYEPFAEAIDGFVASAADSTAAVQANAAKATTFKNAVKGLVEALGSLNNLDRTNPANFTLNDSTKVFNAMMDYAKARQEYLKYTAYKNGTPAIDSNLFYYATAEDPSHHAIVDSSKAIKDLTLANLRDGKYDYTVADYIPAYSTFNAGLGHIASQLFTNQAIADLLTDNSSVLDTSNVNGSGKGLCQLIEEEAIYGHYKVVNPKNPTKVMDGTTEYKGPGAVPTNAKAREAVNEAISNYEKVYKAYWGVNAYPTIATELDPVCYSDTSFTQPFVIANFEGATLDAAELPWTPGLGAVLGSVDPNATDKAVASDLIDYMTGNVAGSAIFGVDKQSDFFKYMFYADKSQVVDKQSLEEIEAWVESVEHAFALDAEGAIMPDVEAYEAYEERYDELAEIYAEGLAWMAGLAYYTGVDEDGYPNGWAGFLGGDGFYRISQPNVPAGTGSMQILGKDVLNQWKWADNVGGRELELAKVLFPELPAVYNGYDAEMDAAKDQEKHLMVLSKAARDVYFAAAKVEGYQEMYVDTATLAPATSIDELIINYKNARAEYIETLVDAIAELEADIDMYKHSIATFKSGEPIINLLIAEAEQVLARDKEQLKKWSQVLSTAQENLDRIIEYLKSLDVNFVLHADELNY